jgi:hypothetical protein
MRAVRRVGELLETFQSRGRATFEKLRAVATGVSRNAKRPKQREYRLRSRLEHIPTCARSELRNLTEDLVVKPFPLAVSILRLREPPARADKV